MSNQILLPQQDEELEGGVKGLDYGSGGGGSTKRTRGLTK